MSARGSLIAETMRVSLHIKRVIVKTLILVCALARMFHASNSTIQAFTPQKTTQTSRNPSSKSAKTFENHSQAKVKHFAKKHSNNSSIRETYVLSFGRHRLSKYVPHISRLWSINDAHCLPYLLSNSIIARARHAKKPVTPRYARRFDVQSPLTLSCLHIFSAQIFNHSRSSHPNSHQPTP